MRIRLCSIVLIISVLMTLFSIPIQAQSGGESAQERALQYVSNTYKISISQLVIIDNYVTDNTITNQKIEGISILDKNSPDGKVWKLVVDSSGTVMDVAEFYKMVANQSQERYGKLSPELYELLQSKSSGDKIKVNVWLKSDATRAADTVAARYPEAKLSGRRPTKDTDMGLYEKIQTEMTKAMKQAYKSSEQPVVELVQSGGFEVFGLADYAPVVFAEISKDTILELQKRPDVEIIYEWRNEYYSPLDNAAPTIGACFWQVQRGPLTAIIKGTTPADSGVISSCLLLSPQALFETVTLPVHLQDMAPVG